jgi:S1-C subfamily serine protease
MAMQDDENGQDGQRPARGSRPDGAATPGTDGAGAAESAPGKPEAEPALTQAVAAPASATQGPPEASAASPPATHAPPQASAAPPKAKWGRGRVLGAYVAVGALGIGIGFGVGALTAHPRPAPVSAAIPAPARQNAAFVEDDDLTAQDNQENILQASAPGVVRIISSSGAPVGAGLVLTPSGKVLTSDQTVQGAGNLTAQFVIAGKTFGAKVIGADPAADLALLQLEGSGKAFPTVAVGNSADIADSTFRSQQFSWHLTGEVTDTAVGARGMLKGVTLNVGFLGSLDAAVTIGGHRLDGLLESTAQVVPGQETGGPLVDLSGQVIGIDIAGAGTGLRTVGFAIPINKALAIARKIDAGHS